MYNKDDTYSILLKTITRIEKEDCKNCGDGCPGCDLFLYILYPLKDGLISLENFKRSKE